VLAFLGEAGDGDGGLPVHPLTLPPAN
jgi:hypothetical protein